MFKELAPLLKKGDTLILTVARATDVQLQVTVTPKLFTLDGENGPDRKTLNQPILLTGTAEELDSPQFIEALNRFTVSTNGLRQTIDDVEAAHKVARESKLSKPAPRASTPAKPKDKDEEVEEEGDNEKAKAAPKAPAKPAEPQEVTASLI